MILALAPMDWITDCAYRIITQDIFDKSKSKNKLYLYTEFMSADWYIHNPQWVFHHILKTNHEKNITAQIFWWNIENLIKTSVDIDKNYKYDKIELNIWCPSPKIMACWGWAWMLRDKDWTLEIIKEIAKSIKKPFSIKTRAWLDNNDKKERFKYIIKASEFCDDISIHWRTFKQWHSWEVDWEFINSIKKEVNNKTKIIWNWWINSYEDAIEKWKNIDWVMIWQSSIWNPWIFTWEKPSNEELKNTIIYHLKLMVILEIKFNEMKKSKYLEEIDINEIKDLIKNISKINLEWLRTPIIFRKHLFAYIKWVKESKNLKQEIITVKNFYELNERIEKFFKSI